MGDAGCAGRYAQPGLAGRCAPAFIQCTLGELITSWTQSVDIAQTTSPAGGYMVSRHFWRLAEHRLAAGRDSSAARSQLKDFLDDETERQQELAARQKTDRKGIGRADGRAPVLRSAVALIFAAAPRMPSNFPTAVEPKSACTWTEIIIGPILLWLQRLLSSRWLHSGIRYQAGFRTGNCHCVELNALS